MTDAPSACNSKEKPPFRDGGLGGCPFAPGFATQPGWFTSDILEAMVGLADEMLGELGEPNRSNTAQGARSEAHAFPWVIIGGPR